ncbi:MAG: phosphoglycerate kinase [Planctomycetes bacterium]|nr:phosphoglycerate kinase [Planctomycetota bacterium]
MSKLALNDIDISGKKVFVRVDFNVPIVDGEIIDSTRIEESIETIKYVSGKAVCFLASHLGRPKGVDAKLSLESVRNELCRLLNKDINFITDFSDKSCLQNCRKGDIFLFENLRFNSGEESNSEEFAKLLAQGMDVYVNEAFSASHRKHASVHAITRFISVKCAGFLLNKEILSLENLLHSPKRPFVLILGGAKINDKVPLLKSLIGKVDTLLIGGAVAFRTFNALGKGGTTDKDVIEIMEIAKKKGVKIILPCDAVITKELKSGAITSVVEDVPDGYIAADIGPKSIKKFEEELKSARTVFWNGPLGAYEYDDFSYGSHKIASFLTSHEMAGAFTVAGGGDVVGALGGFGLKNKFRHVSTGGGACLEFLSGDKLPGFEVLPDKK